MVNNPKYIEEILNELEKIKFEELNEIIQKIDKEYMGTDYKYETEYNIPNIQENYYINEDYYDFYLHSERTSKNKTEKRDIRRIEVAA